MFGARTPRNRVNFSIRKPRFFGAFPFRACSNLFVCKLNFSNERKKERNALKSQMPSFGEKINELRKKRPLLARWLTRLVLASRRQISRLNEWERVGFCFAAPFNLRCRGWRSGSRYLTDAGQGCARRKTWYVCLFHLLSRSPSLHTPSG